MKKVAVAFVCCGLGFSSMAQTDTSKKKDTPIIKIGNMTIVRKDSSGSSSTVYVGPTLPWNKLADKGSGGSDNKKSSLKKISTNWFVWDLGFAGYTDNTNYATSEAQGFLHNQGVISASKGDYALNTSRISNFNFWFFMQKVSLVKSVLNLKYGFGIESNNYFYKSAITYVDGSTPYTIRGAQTGLVKNKLVASYLTVPLMININTNPGKRKTGLQISAGISGGYLQRARQKIKTTDGTIKNKSNFNLEPWKLAYIGELGLGPIKLYGSVATTKLHQYGLNQVPYTVGVRFSN